MGKSSRTIINQITQKYVDDLICKHSKRKDIQKLLKTTENIFSRPLLDKLPKNLSESEKKNLVDDEHIILLSDGSDAIISAGSCIDLFFFQYQGIKKQLIDEIKRGSEEQLSHSLYTIRKLKHFKYDYNDFKVVDHILGGN